MHEAKCVMVRSGGARVCPGAVPSSEHSDARRVFLRMFLAVGFLALSSASCQRVETLSAEDVFQRGVAEFHGRYNAQEFGDIYDSSLSYYRSRYTRTSSREALAALYERNGKVLGTKVLRVRPTSGPTGTGATGIAVTTFQNGVAEETFALFHATSTDEVALFWYECSQLNELLLSGERQKETPSSPTQ